MDLNSVLNIGDVVIEVKCRFCKKIINKDTAYKVRERMYYCDEKCFKKEQTTKKADKSYQNLCDWIENYYIKIGEKDKLNWAIIGSQIKNLIKNNNYKYSGILYTLWYMTNILELNIYYESTGNILGMINCYYENAKKYYAKMQNIKHEIESSKIDDKIIVVKKNISKLQTENIFD